MWKGNINYCEKYFTIYEIKGIVKLLVLTAIYYIVLCMKQTSFYLKLFMCT